MEQDFIKVYSSIDPIRADMAHDILYENNINSVILNKHDSMIQTLGEAEVYVHIDDRLKAIEILKNLES